MRALTHFFTPSHSTHSLPSSRHSLPHTTHSPLIHYSLPHTTHLLTPLTTHSPLTTSHHSYLWDLVSEYVEKLQVLRLSIEGEVLSQREHRLKNAKHFEKDVIR